MILSAIFILYAEDGEKIKILQNEFNLSRFSLGKRDRYGLKKFSTSNIYEICICLVFDHI